jgi:hypothetical protein
MSFDFTWLPPNSGYRYEQRLSSYAQSLSLSLLPIEYHNRQRGIARKCSGPDSADISGEIIILSYRDVSRYSRYLFVVGTVGNAGVKQNRCASYFLKVTVVKRDPWKACVPIALTCLKTYYRTKAIKQLLFILFVGLVTWLLIYTEVNILCMYVFTRLRTRWMSGRSGSCPGKRSFLWRQQP